MDRLVKLAVFNMPFEADFAKSRLDSAGIESFLFDKEIVTMNNFLANAVAGIKLMVKAEDYEQAKEILEEL